MKKVLALIICLLLVISFLFMVIPIRIAFLFSPSSQRIFSRDPPTFEEEPSFFYDSFMSSVHAPLLAKEDELLSVYDYAKTYVEAENRLEVIEQDVKELPETPKYSDDKFEPIYDANQKAKTALLNLILASKETDNFSSTTYFNAENLKPFYEEYLSEKENLYQTTIETFTKEDIVFYLEEDGIITVYNP